MCSVHLSRLVPEQYNVTLGTGLSAYTLRRSHPGSPPNVNTAMHGKLISDEEALFLDTVCANNERISSPLSPLLPPGRSVCSCDKQQLKISMLSLQCEHPPRRL